MRHLHNLPHLAALAQRGKRRRIVMREKARAVHPAVHLQPHRCWLAPIKRQQPLQLRLTMHHRPQAVFRHRRIIGSLKNPFQHHNRLGNSRLAQLHRLFQKRHRKTVRRIMQCARTLHHPVPISVRLHHRQQLVAVQRFQILIIVPQIIQADFTR